MSTDNKEYNGACMCGDVKFKVSGDPAAAGYCHCEICRKWHSAPINAWAVWRNENFEVTQGEEYIDSYRVSEQSLRHWCKNCGSGLYNKKDVPFTVVYAITLENSDFKHEPAMHLYYSERFMDINDNLPKFKDFPTELGGSGELVHQESPSSPDPHIN
jgi:hypothetical protein